MSELDSLKKPKRILKNITFQHDNAALAYTTESAGGAASLKNEAYLFKSLNKIETKELSEEANTASEGDNTSVNQEVSKSNDIKTEEGDQMSDQDQKVVELEKKLKAMTIEKTLTKYGFEAEVEAGLASAMAELEDAVAITKALDALVEAKDALAESHKEALEKALEEKAEEAKTPLEKAIDAEAGHQDVAPVEAMSLVQRTAAMLDEKKGDK